MPARRPDLWDGLLVAGTGGESDGAPLRASDTDGLAQALIAATHSGVGPGAGLYVRCANADDVGRVLSAAVAALTGEDIRAAATGPDWSRIASLGRGAREALRDVVDRLIVPADALDVIVAECGRHAVRGRLSPPDETDGAATLDP